VRAQPGAHHAIAVLFLLVAAPAFADASSICIDASSQNQYNARPLAQHDVLAKNALGADHHAARIATTVSTSIASPWSRCIP